MTKHEKNSNISYQRVSGDYSMYSCVQSAMDMFGSLKLVLTNFAFDIEGKLLSREADSEI